MRKYILLLVFILFSFNARPQVPSIFGIQCLHSDPIESKLKSVDISDRKYDVIYEPASNFPTIVIRVNFIFMQRSDGTGNFQQNNTEHQALINDLINEMNTTFSSMTDPHDAKCYTGSDFIADAKIKFEVNKIYYKDNFGWDNSNDNASNYYCPAFPFDGSYWYLNHIDSLIVNNPSIQRGINIYFTENYNNYFDLIVNRTTNNNNGNGVACSQFPSFTDFKRTSKLHCPNIYTKYWWMKNIGPSEYNQPWNNVMRGWYISSLGRGLAHELGHSLWLYHNCQYYGVNQCYYSIMNQNGTYPRNYLPPSEVGRIHAALSLSNLRAFVKEDTYNIIPLNISTTETWDYEIRSFRDINISSCGILSISSRLIMPFQSKIIVKSGGKLSIENAVLRSISNQWNGIVVENGGYLNITSTSLEDYSIVVKNGGTLSINENVKITGNNRIDIENGGYLCLKSNERISLQDALSVLNLHNGYKTGVNTTYISDPLNCVSTFSSSSIEGNGKINYFSGNKYEQNVIYSTNQYVAGLNIFAGSNVTTSKTAGNVVIPSGKTIIYDADGEITLDKGFEVQLGASFEAK